MSNRNEMIDIMRAREERARAETESYNEARYQLARLDYGSVAITDILSAAKRNGIKQAVDVCVTYEATAMMGSVRYGVYTVTP